MQINISELMKETGYNRILTIKKLKNITDKTLQDCKNIVTPYCDFYNKYGYITNDIADYDSKPNGFFDHSDDNMKLEINKVKFWDSNKKEFLNFEIDLKIAGNHMGLFKLDKLISKIIELPKNNTILVSVEETDYSYNIVTISDFIFCMSKEKAQQVENYFKIYNENISTYCSREHDRISLICNDFDENAIQLALNFLNCSDCDLLLDHDTVVFLQKIFGHEYSDFEFFNKDAVHDKTILANIESYGIAIYDFADILAEDYKLKEEDKKYCAWELINRASIQYFSNIWKQKYELYLENKLSECLSSVSDGTLDKYIEDILLCNEINMDSKTIAYFAYYVLDKKYMRGSIYFPACFETAQYAIEAISENVRKKSFKDRLRGKKLIKQHSNCTIDEVDMMTGNEFEHFICKLFIEMGYSAEVTKQTGDQGIDIIAQKNNIRIGIQAKCYGSTVGNAAIQEVTAGKKFYNCNKVIVVTNNYFTPSAIQLAQANEVILWDRSMLKEKLADQFI